MNAQGKTVWITSVSPRAGRALAAEFASLGAGVTLSARKANIT